MTEQISTIEWDFSSVSGEYERAAWEWEIDRSAFEKGTSWLELYPREQRQVADYFISDSPIKELYLSAHNIETRLAAYELTPFGLHLLEIDWSGSKTAIKLSLSKWVENQYPLRPIGNHNPKANKGGRPPSYMGLLVDLAIHRLHSAGIRRADALGMLANLASRAKIGKTQDNRLSPQHWSHARKRGQHSSAYGLG